MTPSHVGALEQVHSVLALRQEEAIRRTHDRDPKEVMKIPEICHSELRVKKLSEASKKRGRQGCQDDVVDVEQQVGDVGTYFVNKEGRIRGRSSEARPLDEAGEPLVLVPRPGRLLESVQGLLQDTDVIGCRRVDETGRLLAVDCLIQMAVKKGVLHVQLMYRPGAGARGGDAEDDPDGSRFDNRAERLVVVDVVLLQEATNDPSGFMASQRAVSMILMLEDSLAGDDIGTRRSRDETPGAIVHERVVFFSHGHTPIRIGERGARVAWQWRSQAGGRRGKAVPLHGRLQGTRLGTSRPRRGLLWRWSQGHHGLLQWGRRCRLGRLWSRRRSWTTTVVDAEPLAGRGRGGNTCWRRC